MDKMSAFRDKDRANDTLMSFPNEVDAVEQLGTKPKIWFRANDKKKVLVQVH